MQLLDLDDILPYIGEFGRFQKIMIAMITAIYFTMSYEILIIYFSTMIPSWQCVPGYSECPFNVTLPSDDSRRCNMPRAAWKYTESDHYSLATQFDVKCGDEWKLQSTTAIFFVGWGLGSIFFGWFGDNYGRKISLFPSVAGIYLLTFISSFMPNIGLVIACRFFIGFLIPSAIVQPSILITEIVGTKQRPLSGLVPQFAFPVGYAILGVKAYFLKNWKLLSILCTAPYIWTLGFYAFIPESVRFLQQRGRNEEGMEILRKIAKWNKMTLPNDIALKTVDASINKKSGSLFKTKKLTVQTLILGSTWLASAMSFYGLHLASNDLDGNIYTNFIYLGLVGLPAVLLDIYICEKFGRKHAILIPLFLSGIACFGVAFVPAEGKLKTVRVVCGVLGKLLATASLEGLIVWSAEIFNTDVRSKGMGFVNVSARVGATSAPYIAVGLKKFSKPLPFIVMAIPALISALLGISLPETRGAAKMDSDGDPGSSTVIANGATELKRIEENR